MNRLRGSWVLLLALSTLIACATTPVTEGETPGCEVAAEPISFEAACREASSLLALCDAQQCGLYRCLEVMAHPSVGQVVLTRGVAPPLPAAQGGARQYWGSSQELPWDTRPVLIIPWGNKPPLLPSQQKFLEETEAERNKPHEQHHIFSRAFRAWFTRKRINIDEYTIPLELEKHREIHRGPRGGPWNAAWRKWILDHDDATKEEIFRYAGQLIYEFELFGQVRPYRFQPMQPIPPGY